MEAKQPLLYLLFYVGLALSVGTIVLTGSNALTVHDRDEVSVALAAPKAPLSPHSHPHHVLSAMHVGYKIGGKSILRGADMTVSTSCQQTGVMAIIGPSGAGKTTFLDVLAGLKNDRNQKQAGAVGTVSLDGKVLSSEARRKFFGYVMQDETLIPTLTVRESLRFAADLRRRPAAPLCASPFCCLSRCCRACYGTYSENESLVDELLLLLDLKHVADQAVGSVSLRGISGGERKRVAIGMEIICDPQVLLLDEPTTGLDAASAMKVMQVLNTIVRKHRRIVIATIHQPRSDIFRSLGGVTVVVPGGRVVYSGNADGAAPYFQTAVRGLFSGLALDGEPSTIPLVGRPLCYNEASDNPADFIIDQMDVLDDDARGALAVQWKQKSRLQQQQREEQQSNTSSLDSAEDTDASVVTATQMHACGQCCLLFGRASRQLFRSPSLLMLQYGIPAICGLAFGFIYKGITDDLSGVQNLAGSFFAMQVFWCLVSMTALDAWNGERVIVHRELAQGNYGVTAYFVAQLCKEMVLLRVLPPIVFALPFTMLSGKCSEVDSFAIFSVILILTSTSFSALMLLVGACFQNTRSANAVGVLLMVFSLLFGGLLVNKATAVLEPESTWYLPLFYAAPLSYAYEAMMIQVLLGTSINFNPKGFKTRVRTDGQVWLANFGMNGDNAARDLLALGLFTVGVTVMVLPALAFSHGMMCRSDSMCSSKPRRRRIRGDSNIQMSLSAQYVQNRRDGRRSPLLPLDFKGSNVSGTEAIIARGGRGEGRGNSSAGGEEKVSSSSASPHSVPALGSGSLLSHSLRFEGVHASVNKGTCCAGDKIRQILRDVAGEASAKSGGVFAIMGPSGAGKTTLLDVIAGRKTEGSFGGTISVDGVTYSSVSRRKQVFGYVMQDETLVPCLTVMESILFSARLRMDSAAGAAVTDVVNRVIDDLGLSKIAHSRIGAVGGTSGGAGGTGAVGDGSVVDYSDAVLTSASETQSLGKSNTTSRVTSGSRGISGGERKRVSIGMELVINPPVLLLDEPTTGLDAAAATSVMEVLSDLVRQRGTVVICTIHQPRAQVFRRLGRAMILRPLRAGTKDSVSSVVFDGPPSSAEPFFAAQGHICSRGTNIADMILDLVAAEASAVSRGDVESHLLESEQVPMTTLQSTSVLPTTSGGSTQSFGRGAVPESGRGALNQIGDNNCRCLCMKQFLLLFRLEVRRLWRSPGSIIVHAGVAVAVGLLFGFVYRDMQPNLQGTWNRFLGLFSEVTFFGLLGLSAVGNWQPDRVRFLRERASGYYTTLPYYCSKFLVDALVHRIVPVLLFVACSYSLIGWSRRFDSDYVNSDAFLEASSCINADSTAAQRAKAIENSGICNSDPLANSGDAGLDNASGGGLGAFGRSPEAHILFLSLAAISSATLGSLVSASTRSTKVANFLTVLIILLFVMFSGALVSNTGMPWYAGWISYLSPFAFIFEAMSVGNFQDQCFVFNPTTMTSMFGPGKTSSLACVEVPGYKWELNFGCTAAGRWNATDVDVSSGLANCQFNYGTIERDLQAALALLSVYVGLSTVAFVRMRERR
jgi:ABC-type multidrug transport system ATPase subunit